jgi:hypothetical protein
MMPLRDEQRKNSQRDAKIALAARTWETGFPMGLVVFLPPEPSPVLLPLLPGRAAGLLTGLID